MTSSPPSRRVAPPEVPAAVPARRGGPSDGRLCRSFWMAGFEGADHVNMRGEKLDMTDITGHVEQVEADYARLAALGIRSVRESVGWRVVEPRGDGRHDFSRLRRFAAAAERHGIQVMWTLMHYGTPPGLHIMSPDFVPRLRDFAAAAARELRRATGAPTIYTPVNEIGFLAWAVAHTGLIGGQSGRGPRGEALDGYAVKHRLVEAALAAIDAVSEVDRGARFLHVEPLVHVAAPHGRPDLRHAAETFNGYQWQAWDMLLGRLAPELGGSARAVDLIGVNHYHDAQWEFGGGALDWRARDPRRRTFSALLAEAWQRYRLPLVVAETSHVGGNRAEWLDEIAAETCRAADAGVPVQGLCLYPAVDRPDWNDLDHWHHSGLWDIVDAAAVAATREGDRIRPRVGGRGVPRHLDAAYARTLADWQRRTVAAGLEVPASHDDSAAAAAVPAGPAAAAGPRAGPAAPAGPRDTAPAPGSLAPV